MTNYIVDFLKSNNHIGAENGIKAACILSAMWRNISDDSKRRLKAEIRRFRLQWYGNDGIENFILSDTEHGYYLFGDIQEAKHFVKSQKNRAIKAFETSKYIQQYLKEKGYLNKGN